MWEISPLLFDIIQVVLEDVCLMISSKNSILCICWLITTIGLANISEDPAIQKATKYYIDGDYHQAVTEYKRFLFFHPGHPQKSLIYLQMGKVFIQLADFGSAIDLLQVAFQQTNDVAQKLQIGFQLIPVLIAENQTDRAVIVSYRVLTLIDRSSTNVRSDDRARIYFFLGISELYRQNWKAAKSAFLISDLVSSEAITLLDELGKEDVKKSASIAKWLSTFCPGLGQFYAGEWADGINSFLLNGIIASYVSHLFSSGRRQSAILLGSSILWRYYNGNRQNAVKAVGQYNTRLNEKKIDRVLDQLSLKK